MGVMDKKYRKPGFGEDCQDGINRMMSQKMMDFVTAENDRLRKENEGMKELLSLPPYDKLSQLHHSALVSSQALNRMLEAKIIKKDKYIKVLLEFVGEARELAQSVLKDAGVNYE